MTVAICFDGNLSPKVRNYRKEKRINVEENAGNLRKVKANQPC